MLPNKPSPKFANEQEIKIPDLLHDIQSHLNTSRQRENLTLLFYQALHWGKPRGTPRALAIGAPVSWTLTTHPVAQLGGLPVLCVDCPAAHLGAPKAIRESRESTRIN